MKCLCVRTLFLVSFFLSHQFNNAVTSQLKCNLKAFYKEMSHEFNERPCITITLKRSKKLTPIEKLCAYYANWSRDKYYYLAAATPGIALIFKLAEEKQKIDNLGEFIIIDPDTKSSKHVFHKNMDYFQVKYHYQKLKDLANK